MTIRIYWADDWTAFPDGQKYRFKAYWKCNATLEDLQACQNYCAQQKWASYHIIFG